MFENKRNKSERKSTKQQKQKRFVVRLLLVLFFFLSFWGGNPSVSLFAPDVGRLGERFPVLHLLPASPSAEIPLVDVAPSSAETRSLRTMAWEPGGDWAHVDSRFSVGPEGNQTLKPQEHKCIDPFRTCFWFTL